ncbi:peptidoglycan DD-metalloendopeptidase family protein [Aminivibrio sp.]|uniref:peptidoglycan DD-metalloendopeptidase family protein n=1 Tax=Aminivibrio sp. TaxID=1872489 RepID=UPI001A42AEE9|nr:M23 family metallopeptidase [Aminivibrio sp.]MBL3538673.1 LysM peptidoglycan-binding domain-containing M23 family metallopeptidase [Aminivibrio sp.]MDK2958149.1 lipoprotein NlpD [Synergistaceae bacterium]
MLFPRRFAFLSVFSVFFSVLAAFPFSPAASANSLPWVEHSVRSGESVAFIAGRYGVSPKTVERANELAVREDGVLPGEKLLVPRKDSDLLATLAEHRARQRGETIVPLIRIEEPLPPPAPPKKAESALADGIEPLIRPLGGRVSSPFGKRRGRLHDGIDIPARPGTPVVAIRSGRVVFSGVIRGFGNTVTIDHGNGFVTRYSHNSANLVKKGTWVRRGQPVAKVGKTGRTTCNHLHFSVLVNGKPVNPEKYLPK